MNTALASTTHLTSLHGWSAGVCAAAANGRSYAGLVRSVQRPTNATTAQPMDISGLEFSKLGARRAYEDLMEPGEGSA